jgi:hypothetical protein
MVVDVKVVDDLVVLDFVDDAVLGVEARTELGVTLVTSIVAVLDRMAQDLIFVLLETGVDDEGEALELDPHGLA